jgi:hypothetical protein
MLQAIVSSALFAYMDAGKERQLCPRLRVDAGGFRLTSRDERTGKGLQETILAGGTRTEISSSQSDCFIRSIEAGPTVDHEATLTTEMER